MLWRFSFTISVHPVVYKMESTTTMVQLIFLSYILTLFNSCFTRRSMARDGTLLYILIIKTWGGKNQLFTRKTSRVCRIVKIVYACQTITLWTKHNSRFALIYKVYQIVKEVRNNKWPKRFTCVMSRTGPVLVQIVHIQVVNSAQNTILIGYNDWITIRFPVCL